MVEPDRKKQPFAELSDRDFKAIVQSYWNFAGELTRKEFYQRIWLLAILSVPSLLLVLIPVLGPIYVLALTAALASVVIQRLRHLAKPWWLVFFLLLPVLGWVILGFFVASKGAKDSDDDGLSPAHIFFNGLAVFTVALLLSIALAINGEPSSDSRSVQSSDSSELSDQAVESDSESSSADPQDTDVGGLDSDEIAESAELEEEASEEDNPESDQEDSASGVVNQTFDELFAGLQIEAEVTSGYDRSLFKHWVDADGDGCDARREVLIAESTTKVTVGGGCSLSGGTWVSAFDGVSTTDSSSFDVDHFVPLKEAWDSGANEWDSATRQNFANDLGYEMSLIAVSASSNRSKGASDPSEWMPPASSFKCEYVYSWIQVKLRWQLSVDSAEASALRNNWAGCTVEGLDFNAKATGARIGTAPEPTPAPEPETNNQDSAAQAPTTPEPEASGCVNINTASFEELRQIIHIDVDRANQILTLRPFSSVDSMVRIKGIAEGRLADIKAQGLACAG